MDKEIAEKETAEKLMSMTQQAEEYKVRWSTHSDQLQVLQTCSYERVDTVLYSIK